MFGGKYKWMWTVAEIQVEEVVGDELPTGLRELRPAIWDDIVARAKAGKCYYPIQDKSGVWRNYHYYSSGTFVPPSSLQERQDANVARERSSPGTRGDPDHELSIHLLPRQKRKQAPWI